jgi:hypothetical protein
LEVITFEECYLLWCRVTPNVVLTLLDGWDLNGKHAAVFTTSGPTKSVKLAVKLKKSYL